MLETIAGDLYDYPKYYDLVYGCDWKAEFDFLQAAFTKHARRKVEHVFEPACGTGRLMIKLAQAGYEIAGLDLNAKAVAYCNRRLKSKGFPESAFVGDMSDFQLEEPVDAAFNMINSFRHLASGAKSEQHLRCVAESLQPGGVYVLGLHLTPTEEDPIEEETWSARRGHLMVISHLQTIDRDLESREERVRMGFDVYTPSQQFRLEGETVFRTYTADQIQDFFRCAPELEIAEIYDFSYEIDHPLEQLTPKTEDVVFVLRKR